MLRGVFIVMKISTTVFIMFPAFICYSLPNKIFISYSSPLDFVLVPL